MKSSDRGCTVHYRETREARRASLLRDPSQMEKKSGIQKPRGLLGGSGTPVATMVCPGMRCFRDVCGRLSHCGCWTLQQSVEV